MPERTVNKELCKYFTKFDKKVSRISLPWIYVYKAKHVIRANLRKIQALDCSQFKIKIITCTIDIYQKY